MIIMIAAVAENNALGKNNELVWHLPNDFKRFKELTSHHHIIMGRKTFESLDGPLPNRKHIVVTRQKDYNPGNDIVVVHDIKEAVSKVNDDDNAFIIGGGEIYRLGIKYATHIELTRVHANFEAEAFFPEIDQNDWELINSEFHDTDARHKYTFTYLTYARQSS